MIPIIIKISGQSSVKVEQSIQTMQWLETIYGRLNKSFSQDSHHWSCAEAIFYDQDRGQMVVRVPWDGAEEGDAIYEWFQYTKLV